MTDALLRGLGPIASPAGMAVEVGSGIGAYSNLLAERFATVVAVDLSLAMLKVAPIGPPSRAAEGHWCVQTFWSARFGVVVDRFGIPFEVSCGRDPLAT